MLSSIVPGGKSLKAFLEAAGARAGTDYECSIASCLPAYTSSDEAALTTLTLRQEEQAFGFIIQGNDVAVQGIDFMLASELPESCSPQLMLSAFDDNVSLIANTKAVESGSCSGSTSGCFSQELGASDYKRVTLSTTNYCNNITLPAAPAYRLRARVQASANTSALVLTLFDAEGAMRGSCTTSVKGTGSQEAKCIINYSSVESRSFFACVSAKESKNEYEMNFETSGAVCGGAGVGKTGSGDYDIEVTPLPYAPLSNVSVAAAYKRLRGESIASAADQYLERVYARNCTKGCTLPFMIRGGAQTLEFQNISTVYTAEGNRITERGLKRFVRQEPLLTSKKQLILDVAAAEFTLPLTAANTRFTLRLGETNLLGSGIALNVTPGFDFEIAPRIALPGVDTKFTALTQETIVESIWNFGDGSSKNESGKSVMYRYGPSNKTYMLRVTLKNDKGTSVTKQQEIIIGNPRESLPQLLNATSAELGNVSAAIAALPAVVQGAVKERLNVSALTAEVATIKSAAAKATNESEFTTLLVQLLSLSIPRDVTISDSGVVPVMLGLNKIDTVFVQRLANASIPSDKEEALQGNLIDWNRRAFGGEVSFEVVSVQDAHGAVMPLLTHFTVKPQKNIEYKETVYFVIDRPRESVVFIGNPEVRVITDGRVSGTAVKYTGQPIEFTLEGDATYQELGAHFAPALDALGSYEERKPWKQKDYPWKWVLFWLALLLVTTLVAYFILKRWYNNRYERYLFKNPDDLFNLLSFIDNARSSGTGDGATHRNLQSSGWSNEQITYAFKKIDGKSTGMLELPLFGASRKARVQEEMRRRREGGSDAKFIKRPSL
jgi:PKD repeat protein